MKQLTCKSGKEWRQWLAQNHDREKEVWLIFFKKKTGFHSFIDYDSAVEEALCYGWIDSIIKRIDEKRYMRKFTPRNDHSVWSESNIKRVEKLTLEGKMTDPGLRKVEAAKKTGQWKPEKRPVLTFKEPAEFSKLLEQFPDAKENYELLSRTHQQEYIGWIITAIKEETRKKRIRESITLLQKGRKLGLK